jgi:type II secretory pathway predicted ATPase ExeA
MYLAFFGLREQPFNLTTDVRFLFLSAGHREALALLQYGLVGEKGLALLVGDAGTGKTTLLRAAIAQHSTEIQTLYLNNPTLTRREFYEFLAEGLGLPPATVESKATFLRELEQRLANRREAGSRTALVIDEAQAIPAELLEEIRMLANLESTTAKLLAVVLTGQPELAERLKLKTLAPLKQRIALRTQIPAFTVRETAGYIAKRLIVAGGTPASIFDQSAVELIHQASRGIPRTISVICDNSLITAFALRARPVTGAIVAEVCTDLDYAIDSPTAHRGAPRPLASATPLPPPPATEAETAPLQLLGPPRPLTVIRGVGRSSDRARIAQLKPDVLQADSRRGFGDEPASAGGAAR